MYNLHFEINWVTREFFRFGDDIDNHIILYLYKTYDDSFLTIENMLLLATADPLET